MAELLAKNEEVQKWLPADKLLVGPGDVDEYQLEAYRLIKGQMVGVFDPVTLAAWDSPSTTPATIRSIAGRIIAAYYYKLRYSEDSREIPQYAQNLYDEAIAMLTQIRSGSLTVVDDNGDPVSATQLSAFGTGDFYPDNTAPGPYFTIEREWA